jgi:hypothetical protein
MGSGHNVTIIRINANLIDWGGVSTTLNPQVGRAGGHLGFDDTA